MDASDILAAALKDIRKGKYSDKNIEADPLMDLLKKKKSGDGKGIISVKVISAVPKKMEHEGQMGGMGGIDEEEVGEGPEEDDDSEEENPARGENLRSIRELMGGARKTPEEEEESRKRRKEILDL